MIYDTAPIGLAFLSTDCRYLNINQRLTEICGLPIAVHLGRSVRETVPQVDEQVEHIVHTIVRSGEPINGIEVNGQRPDGSNLERVWVTYWHPLKNRGGDVVGINVTAEEITERKRADNHLSAVQECQIASNCGSDANSMGIKARQSVWPEEDRAWRVHTSGA